MREFKVKIVGVTPYMQHRMDDESLQEWEKRRSRIIENDHANAASRTRALYHSYIDEEGNFYMPSEHLKQSFIKGAMNVKGKVGTASKSMKTTVAGMWRIKEERIPMPHFDEVDSRSAVNNNVKARIMVHRPRWNNWSVEFTLMIDDDPKSQMLDAMIMDIMSLAGRYVGIGSYRPEHTGEFGRFNVVELKQCAGDEPALETATKPRKTKTTK